MLSRWSQWSSSKEQMKTCKCKCAFQSHHFEQKTERVRCIYFTRCLSKVFLCLFPCQKCQNGKRNTKFMSRKMQKARMDVKLLHRFADLKVSKLDLFSVLCGTIYRIFNHLCIHLYFAQNKATGMWQKWRQLCRIRNLFVMLFESML